MKYKILSILTALLICVSPVIGNPITVSAEEMITENPDAEQENHPEEEQEKPEEQSGVPLPEVKPAHVEDPEHGNDEF